MEVGACRLTAMFWSSLPFCPPSPFKSKHSKGVPNSNFRSVRKHVTIAYMSLKSLTRADPVCHGLCPNVIKRRLRTNELVRWDKESQSSERRVTPWRSGPPRFIDHGRYIMYDEWWLFYLIEGNTVGVKVNPPTMENPLGKAGPALTCLGVPRYV